MKKYFLFGLGPHARRIYIPFLEDLNSTTEIEIELLIDLEDQEQKIRNYLKSHSLKINGFQFLPTKDRHRKSIDSQLEKKLQNILRKTNIDGVIISTEPKSHLKYAVWALKNDLDVLMDKPLTSPINSISSREASTQILNDYKKLLSLEKKSKGRVYVQCQRRYHKGYKFLHKYLDDIVNSEGVPITYMDIYHADGMWNMPNEFLSRENHPYKYGYGKLLHSGYHFVDLYSWFNDINENIDRLKSDITSIFSQSYRPTDFLYTLNQPFYAKHSLLTKEIEDAFNCKFKKQKFGELDVYIQLQTKKDGNVINTSSLNLLQNSFSRRSWAYLPEDTYKGNGRVRHERFTAQVSNLLSVQVHSYQSYEVKKKDVKTTGAGAEDHFDIYIFRNSKLIGGKPLEKIPFGEKEKSKNPGDIYIGHNEEARRECIRDFVNKRISISNLENHLKTNLLLSNIYTNLVRETNNQTPFSIINSQEQQL